MFPSLATLAAALVAAPPGTAADPPAPKRPPGPALVMPDKERRNVPRGADLSSLRRLVRSFDFEDAERFPTEMPRDWYRVLTGVSGRPGFPDFGAIELTDGVARDGKWSLQFSMVGGSMAVAVPPGVVRIFPGSRYRISCWMRTDGLQHSSARMIARLHDRDGKPTGDEVATEPMRSEGEWTQIRIDLPEVSQRASDISLELQVVQDSTLPDDTGRTAQEAGKRVVDDIAGKAWFDDVEVWQIPSIRFGNQHAAQVLGADGGSEIEIELRDLVSDELMADITVADIDGNIVHVTRIPLPGAGALVKVPLPRLDPGAYTASLTVTADNIVLAKRTVDLAVLDREREATSHGSWPRFGVVLPAIPDAELPSMREIVREIDPDFAIVPAWTPDFETARTDSRIAAMRDFVDSLLDRRIEPMLAVTSVPASLAAPRHLDRWQTLEYFGDEDGSARAQLEPWLLAFGQHVERWQLGDGMAHSDDQRDDREAAARVRAALDQRVAGPVLLLPAEADRDLPDPPPGVAHHVRIPWSARPATIAQYLEPWRDAETIVTFEGAPSAIADRMSVEDLAMRAIHAWRAGARTMAVDLAWRPGNEAESRAASLKGEAIAWREIGRSLSGRTFAGEIPAPDGIHVWLAYGARPAVILWSDDALGGGQPLRMLLANSTVTTIDPFGRRCLLSPVNGMQEIPVSATPLFIEGVDIGLMRTLASAAFEPATLESRRSQQEAWIVLKNAFPVSLSGTLSIADQQAWEISPRSQTFTVPAGGIGRIPIRIGLPRSTTVGPSRLDVKLDGMAGEPYVTTIPLRMAIDWPDVEVHSAWRFARAVDTGRIDVVASIAVTNRGNEPIDLEAFALARDYTQTRRPILKLGPGETAMRVFQFPDGARRLSGHHLFAGVSEMDGERRYTSQLSIPPFLTPPARPSATVAADSSANR